MPTEHSLRKYKYDVFAGLDALREYHPELVEELIADVGDDGPWVDGNIYYFPDDGAYGKYIITESYNEIGMLFAKNDELRKLIPYIDCEALGRDTFEQDDPAYTWSSRSGEMLLTEAGW